MGTVALRMLFGDPGKYLGLVFAIAFSISFMLGFPCALVGLFG